jgi:5-formyltetrahydrofolate cyclo-ligase
MMKGADIDTNAEAGRVRDREEILLILSTFEHGITFKSVPVEPDPQTLFPELSSKILYTILPIATLDPLSEAQKARKLAGNASVYLFIPGRKFDAMGTRHGKGAGWYDRFLSQIPREWLRIGLCTPEQFSKETLVRQPWDEEMDFVCVTVY